MQIIKGGKNINQGKDKESKQKNRKYKNGNAKADWYNNWNKIHILFSQQRLEMAEERIGIFKTDEKNLSTWKTEGKDLGKLKWVSDTQGKKAVIIKHKQNLQSRMREDLKPGRLKWMNEWMNK